MNKITQFAVRYPVSVLMIVIGVCLLGIISYNKLGTDLFPDLKNPALYITIDAGQRPPEEMERQYTDQIEAIASRQAGVKSVYSVSKTGSARITVEYSWDQDMDMAYLDLQRSVARIGQNNNEVTSLEIERYDANNAPTIQLALTHEGKKDMNDLRKIAENYMRSELVRLDGVADIQIAGQEEAVIKIKTDDYMMKAFNLTADQLVSKISDVNQNVSGGSIVYDDRTFSIKGVNIIKDINSLGDIIVAFKTEEQDGMMIQSPVYLHDIAEIKVENSDPDNIVRLNGERCLGINIYKENKFNTVQAVNNINKKLSEMEKSLPGYKFHIINNQGRFINSAIGEVKESALLGILLAMIVLFLFLRRMNVTLIMSVSIPISIIATFNLMYFNGLTLNIMTLGGLALGAGMLVDNAIVVMENIYRHHEMGESPKDAAINGASEVSGAITASTLTTIVVFLPIVYIQGAAGELFKEQAWTVTFSLVSSLFIALLLIPMLASRYILDKGQMFHAIKINGIKPLVHKALHKRYAVVGGAFLLLIGAYALTPFIDKEFMPKSESNEFTLLATLAPGTQLAVTDRTLGDIENIINETAQQDIEWIYSSVGPITNTTSSNTEADGNNQGRLTVKLKKDSHLTANDLIDLVNKRIPSSEYVSLSYQNTQSALESILDIDKAPLSIEIKGEDLDVLEKYAQIITDSLQHVEGLYDVKSSYEQGAPEITVVVDRLKTGIYGINVASVSQQIEEQLNGKKAGEFEDGGELINIKVEVPKTSYQNLKDLEIVQGQQHYRLAEIANITETFSPKEIKRRNQNRIMEVTANLNKNVSLSQVTPQVKELLNKINLPAKYTATITGEEAKRAESFSGLTFALILSIVLVYMVMASQFESLVHPFTILLTIPFATVGCILFFLILGISLNMMAFIGIIMLGGIAVNNSILIVDATNKYRAKGMEINEALESAAQQRIRPILMTTLTTILALLPMCFNFGEGASLRMPMAIAVIGGLITSTLMTLIVIPCVYRIIDRKKKA